MEVEQVRKVGHRAWPVRIRSVKYPFGNVNKFCGMSPPIFSFSQVLDVFPFDTIGEVLQRNSSCTAKKRIQLLFSVSFEGYYFPEYECFDRFHSP
jgi:hypothetical protein